MAAHHDTARDAFPAGLVQPDGSFRFSQDALLLSSYALRCFPERGRPAHIVDLGCGCGVIGFACLLACETATAEGLDREAELIAAARENARLLGMTDRFSARVCDVADDAARARLERGRADIVLANMPYHAEGSGRPPRSPLRRRAFFAEPAVFSGFMLAAYEMMKPDGVFALIRPWLGRETLLAGLERHGLFPERLLPVCTSGKENTLCLVSCRKTPAAMRVLPALSLRGEKGGDYSPEARAFCPWLRHG